jgi:hypothetical protein
VLEELDDPLLLKDEEEADIEALDSDDSLLDPSEVPDGSNLPSLLPCHFTLKASSLP